MACISETRTLPRALQTAFDMFDMGHGSKSIEDLLTSHLALSQNWIPTPTLNSLAPFPHFSISVKWALPPFLRQTQGLVPLQQAPGFEMLCRITWISSILLRHIPRCLGEIGHWERRHQSLDWGFWSKAIEVHVFGKADEFYDYGRDGFGYKPQEDAEKSRATNIHKRSFSLGPLVNHVYIN